MMNNQAMMEKRPNHRPPRERVITQRLEAGRIYSIYEVSELLGLHHNTVRTMIKRGELPAKKLGLNWRIKGADLERFVSPVKEEVEG